jgi:putative ABC transport system permease protein
MPGSFRHPSATVETDVDVWAPTGWKAAPFPPPGYSAKFMPSAIGRMPRGMSIDEARARVTALGAEITREHPDDYPARVGWTPRVQPLVAHLVEHIRPALLVLMGGIAFVLLIAISNVSNLLLVRAVEREREVAIQRALGAPRSRMLVSFAIEGLVLAVIAGGAGFLASLWGVDLLLRLVPDRLPRVDEIVVDARVFLFAMTTSIVAGLLVSVGPSLQSARADVVERLKASGWGLRGGVRARVRNALVVAQVAIAMVLLAGAALLVRSLSNLQHIETGMRAERVTTARLWLPQPNEPSTGPYFDPARRRALIRGVLDRLQWSADLAEAGIATSLPTADDSGTTAFAVEGWQPERRDIATATVVSATPGYFRALGIGLSAGRFPTDADNEQTDRVAVVNETLARTYFAGADPVGRRICFIGRRGQLPAQPTWMTIVGVARDVREDRIDAAVRPQIYQSLLQAPAPLSLAIVAQGRAKPPSAQVLTSAVQQTDANLPVYAIRTAEDLVAAQLASRRFATTLVNAFAASALLLAAFGLHGVIAYGVRQRTREIGLRLALGATAARIVRLIAGQGARMTALGLTIGTIGALIFSQLISALLFDVKPGDPVTLIAAALLLVGVVALATLGAAWRATRIEAAVALRHD